MLLIDKYKPKEYKDLLGQAKALKNLHDFVADFKKFKQKSALVYGPPGIGKTISIKKLAEKLDLEIIELNASDFRNKEAIERIIGGSIMQRSLFNRSKLILIDEVDGISGNEDRGGLVE
ncbi:AAA family ATPase, partial [Candidatus Woesearchaeota archaeon]|nr:AAA family ATPase [Candidatus Woesearchaeota archaeon]